MAPPARRAADQNVTQTACDKRMISSRAFFMSVLAIAATGTLAGVAYLTAGISERTEKMSVSMHDRMLRDQARHEATGISNQRQDTLIAQQQKLEDRQGKVLEKVRDSVQEIQKDIVEIKTRLPKPTP